MPLKGLVKFFTIAMVLVCLFQLSITYFVNRKEADVQARVDKKLKQQFPLDADAKYPNKTENDSILRSSYTDSMSTAKATLYINEDKKAAKEKTAYWMNYRQAKKSQLQLGLDLQGGMSVTMEVALDELLKKLSVNKNDLNLNNALAEATKRKANTSANYIKLFKEEYDRIAPNGSLASLFSSNSNGKLKFNSSNNEVITYLNEVSDDAFKTNINTISKRLDGFGLTQPGIYPDNETKTVTIEMAGVH
jgi:SecD/SecF fusion protein